ncbi:hypothetical protein DXG03_004426 [Asterophora parasitica]|uniref:F-box domain-containing protein n=1 Tax=Asterophora parasitica TaxID=117018 RepID=A0A9P7G0K9_9AGAR|nr:hypothetical protein DXG03_004426 [Asterophora parasitica]
MEVMVDCEPALAEAFTLATLLGESNSGLSRAERGILSAAICHVDEEIDSSNSTLSALQLQINTTLREMQRVKKRNSTLKAQKKAFLSFGAPLRRFPAEVLSHIFSFHAYEEINSPVSTLLSASQVCRSWRHASLACASLWTKLSIDTRKLQERNLQKLPDVWFRNAKHLRVSFSLNCSPNQYPSPKNLFSCGALDPIFPSFPRISELQLLWPDMNALFTLFQLPRGTFSSLQSLHISTEPLFGKRLRRITSTEVFILAPFLRRAILDIEPIKLWLVSDFVFPWGQLTHLKVIQLLQVNQWLSILSQCTQLQHGFFVLTYGGNDLPIMPHITFPSLTTLTLSFQWGTQQSHVLLPERLENFTFPALQHLTIISNAALLMDELLESFPPSLLRSLTLRDMTLRLDTFLKFLGGCNLLEILRIDLPWLNMPDLRYGWPPDILAPVLDNLKSFEVCISADKPADDEDDDDSTEDDSTENDSTEGDSVIDRARFITPDSLAALLQWWNKSPSPFQRAAVYAYEEAGDFRVSENGYNVVRVNRADTFISGLKSILQDSLFNEATRPSGLILKVKAFKGRAYGIDHPFKLNIFGQVTG